MSEIIRIAEQAHMAGQYSAGVDPSYSEARAYCSGLELPNVDELKALLNERETECINAKDYMVKQAGTINELAAHIERLRHTLAEVHSSLIKDVYTQHPLRESMERTLTETPVQSLNHVRAQVEEETIQADIEFLDDMACEHSGNLNNRLRKYKEQSDED